MEWAAPAGRSLLLNSGRGLCARCWRALALCALRPTAKKIQNSRHKRAIDPELRQHTETPAVIKVAAVIADAAVPTAAAATTATVSEPSRMAPREERAERRCSARTRRPLRQRPPYEHAMLRARAGSRLVAVVGCGRPEHGVRSRVG